MGLLPGLVGVEVGVVDMGCTMAGGLAPVAVVLGWVEEAAGVALL